MFVEERKLALFVEISLHRSSSKFSVIHAYQTFITENFNEDFWKEISTMTTLFSSSWTGQSASKFRLCKTVPLCMNLKPLAGDCATFYTNTGQGSSQAFASLRSLPNSAAVLFLLHMLHLCFLCCFVNFRRR